MSRGAAAWSMVLLAHCASACAPVCKCLPNGATSIEPGPRPVAAAKGSGACSRTQPPLYVAGSMLAEQIPPGSAKYADARETIPGPLDTIFLFDPRTRKLSSAPAPTPPRREATIVALDGGRALAIGGQGEGSDDILVYDGKNGWSKAGHIDGAPLVATAVQLPSGDVLVTGGVTSSKSTAEVLDRAFVVRAPDMAVGKLASMKTRRFDHAMAALPDGKVLVIGGAKGGQPDASTEVFDPSTGDFSVGELLPVPITNPSAATSPVGGIVVTGFEGVFYHPPGEAWVALSNTPHQSSQVVVFPDCVALVATDAFVEAWDLTSRRLLQTLRPILQRGRQSHLVLLDERTAILAGGESDNASTSAEAFTRVPSLPQKPPFEWRAVTSSEIHADGAPSPIAFQSNEGIVSVPRNGQARLDYDRGGYQESIGASLTPVGERVLVAGGTNTHYDDDEPEDGLSPTRGASETGLIDIETGGWSRTGQPRPRWNHVAVTLRDGKVALFGGEIVKRGVREVEAWNDASRRFRGMGALQHPRLGHTATALPDGSVLVAGHCNVGLEGSINPAFVDLVAARTAEHWHPSGKVEVSPLTVERCLHAAAPLSDGRVLIAGGFAADDQSSANLGQPVVYLSDPRKSAEVWDPHTNTWSKLPDMNEPRGHVTALTLPDGRVLVAGGLEGVLGQQAPATVEAYDPRTNTWSILGRLPRPINGTPILSVLGPERVLLVTEGEMYELTIAAR